jgi:hypothetical protein
VSVVVSEGRRREWRWRDGPMGGGAAYIRGGSCGRRECWSRRVSEALNLVRSSVWCGGKASNSSERSKRSEVESEWGHFRIEH